MVFTVIFLSFSYSFSRMYVANVADWQVPVLDEIGEYLLVCLWFTTDVVGTRFKLSGSIIVYVPICSPNVSLSSNKYIYRCGGVWAYVHVSHCRELTKWSMNEWMNGVCLLFFRSCVNNNNSPSHWKRFFSSYSNLSFNSFIHSSVHTYIYLTLAMYKLENGLDPKKQYKLLLVHQCLCVCVQSPWSRDSCLITH